MVAAESRDVGMDKALERARTLHTAVEVALKNFRLDSHEMSGLREIRTNIAMLENKIREIKVTKDAASKAGLLAELHPIRQQLIEECHRNQGAVVESQGLVQEILDWCELRATTTATPATYRSSIDDVQRSTEALITNSGLGTATDVSSSWVQSQAQAPHNKSSAFGSSAASLSLSNWDPKQTRLRPLKTAVGNSSAAHSNGTSKASSPSLHAQALLSQQQQQQQSGTPDQLRSDQTLVPPAVVAAGTATPKIHQATEAARAHAAKLTAQRQSMEQQALEQQQQNWEGQLNEAQQLARRLAQTQRPVRSFLHLDGRTDASLTSSGASSQLAAYYPLGDMGVSRYSNHKDDDVTDPEPAAANGWEAVQHLRQPAAQRSSMRTSMDRASVDIQRALRAGNVTEAAILSSNASRVHILHDAVPRKRHADGQMFDVPVIPPCLAVNKKRRWWVKLLQAVATTAGLAVAVGAAGIAATGGIEGIRSFDNVKSRIRKVTHDIKIHKPQTPSLAAEPSTIPASKTDTSASSSSSSGSSAAGGQQQLQQQRSVGMPRLPYVPVGPAPDASAGCG